MRLSAACRTRVPTVVCRPQSPGEGSCGVGQDRCGRVLRWAQGPAHRSWARRTLPATLRSWSSAGPAPGQSLCLAVDWTRARSGGPRGRPPQGRSLAGFLTTALDCRRWPDRRTQNGTQKSADPGCVTIRPSPPHPVLCLLTCGRRCGELTRRVASGAVGLIELLRIRRVGFESLRARSGLRQTTGPRPAETLSGAYSCPDGGRRSGPRGPKMSGQVVAWPVMTGSLRSLGHGSDGWGDGA